LVTPKTPRLEEGDVVADRYRIDGIVGRGGFGAVYQATQIDTGISVALKILLKNFSSSKTDSKRFRREASLVQKLQHPNVVALLDFGETDRGQPYIAFELLEGEALGKVLKESGRLPLWRASQITRDVLSALEAAHALGVIHRDIKPQNIFLCAGTRGTKVLDFGIAKTVTDEAAGATQLTEAGQMIGTPHYMAPEQVRGAGIYPATDLYSLGLLMAEMLTGTRVVRGNALIDVYLQHITPGAIQFDPEVQRSVLAPIILRATAKDLDERYRSASEMLTDLDAAVPVAAIANNPRTEAFPATGMSGTVLFTGGEPPMAAPLSSAPLSGAASSVPAPSSVPPNSGPAASSSPPSVPATMMMNQMRYAPASVATPPSAPPPVGASGVPKSVGGSPLDETVDMSDDELQRVRRALLASRGGGSSRQPPRALTPVSQSAASLSASSPSVSISGAAISSASPSSPLTASPLSARVSPFGTLPVSSQRAGATSVVAQRAPPSPQPPAPPPPAHQAPAHQAPAHQAHAHQPSAHQPPAHQAPVPQATPSRPQPGPPSPQLHAPSAGMQHAAAAAAHAAAFGQAQRSSMSTHSGGAAHAMQHPAGLSSGGQGMPPVRPLAYSGEQVPPTEPSARRGGGIAIVIIALLLIATATALYFWAPWARY
jgi:serine/threonine-protein kinase